MKLNKRRMDRAADDSFNPVVKGMSHTRTKPQPSDVCKGVNKGNGGEKQF